MGLGLTHEIGSKVNAVPVSRFAGFEHGLLKLSSDRDSAVCSVFRDMIQANGLSSSSSLYSSVLCSMCVCALRMRVESTCENYYFFNYPRLPE